MSDGAERLCRDLHPVEVSIGAKIVKGARVFITTDRVIVYREVGEHTGLKRPSIAFSAEVTGESPQPSRSGLTGPMSIDTSEGTVLLNRAAGCGCNSILKTLSSPVTW